jgi:hypothetical protein
MDKAPMTYFLSHILSAGTAYVRGKVGEKLVQLMLESQGYRVSVPDRKCQGDLTVTDLTTGEALRVEVMTGLAGSNREFKFCLQKDDRYGGTNCGRADVLILLAVTRAGSHALFVIPTGDLAQKSIAICGDPHQYRGKWSGYRQYHNTLNLRTNVHFFSDRFAKSRNTVYSGGAGSN